MISDEAVEAAARVLDPAIWSLDLPVGTRADTLDFHARRQASCVKARAALEAALPHLLDREKVARVIGDVMGHRRWDEMAPDKRALRQLMRHHGEGSFDINEPTHADCLDAADAILAHPQKGGEG